MKNLFKSLSSFQQEVPVILRDTQGYGYKYADLPAIFEVINPLLKKHGLGFSQPINGQSITTIIYHIESGEKLESTTDIPQNVQLKGMNDFQVLGSAITYLRRYALSSVLGIVADKDTDASGEQTKTDTKELQWLNVYEKDTKDLTRDMNRVYAKMKTGEYKDIKDIRKDFKVSKINESIIQGWFAKLKKQTA